MDIKSQSAHWGRHSILTFFLFSFEKEKKGHGLRSAIILSTPVSARTPVQHLPKHLKLILKQTCSSHFVDLTQGRCAGISITADLVSASCCTSTPGTQTLCVWLCCHADAPGRPDGHKNCQQQVVLSQKKNLFYSMQVRLKRSQMMWRGRAWAQTLSHWETLVQMLMIRL